VPPMGRPDDRGHRLPAGALFGPRPHRDHVGVQLDKRQPAGGRPAARVHRHHCIGGGAGDLLSRHRRAAALWRDCAGRRGGDRRHPRPAWLSQRHGDVRSRVDDPGRTRMSSEVQATAATTTASPTGFVQVLRRYPLVSYFVMAYAITWFYVLVLELI